MRETEPGISFDSPTHLAFNCLYLNSVAFPVSPTGFWPPMHKHANSGYCSVKAQALKMLQIELDFSVLQFADCRSR
jgi:hypothetical protein